MNRGMPLQHVEDAGCKLRLILGPFYYVTIKKKNNKREINFIVHFTLSHSLW
jgi:hypothetical protein